MQLEPGYRFSLAPRFTSGLAWSQRLQIEGGEARGEPLNSADLAWHPASESQLDALVTSKSPEDAWRRDICLFAIPEHLRAKWWEMAARQIETLPTRLDGMEPFARAVAEFAQFKRVPLPRQCAFDVTLTSPDQGSIEKPSAGQVPRRSWVVEATDGSSPLVARINLGDERTALIFLNLSRSRMAEMLKLQGHKAAAATETSDQVDAFLSIFSGYPLLRLFLDPGEGIWLPNDEVIYRVDRSGKADLDVWLTLKDDGGRLKGEAN
jgi:hypothetical protein